MTEEISFINGSQNAVYIFIDMVTSDQYSLREHIQKQLRDIILFLYIQWQLYQVHEANELDYALIQNAI
jgi:hypothetical protein